MADYLDYVKGMFPDSTVNSNETFVGYFNAQNTSFSVPARGNNTFTVSLTDPGYSYYLYTVDIQPVSTPLYRVAAFAGSNVIAYGISNGKYVHFDLNTPSLRLFAGSAYKITIYNLATSAQTFGVFCYGAIYLL